MKRTVHLAMALALGLLGQRANATTIAAVWEPTFVAIGADSKETDSEGNAHGAVCKIHGHNGVYWAFAGPVFDFTTPTIIRDLKHTAPLSKMVDAFIRDFEPLAKWEVINDADIREHILKHPDRGFFDIVFADIENKIPKMYEVKISVTFGNGVPSISHKTLSWPGDKDHLIEFGWNESGPTVHLPPNTDAFSAIKLYIQSEIDHAPDHVGPPISIFGLRNDGETAWFEKGLCNG